MRSADARARESCSESVQRGARDKWSDADSVVQQRSEEDEAGGVAAGRRVVSQCAGDCA